MRHPAVGREAECAIVKTETPETVLVAGGGMVGVETAEYLAEKGTCVTVLEMLPEICADLGAPRKICVNESVYAAGIVPVTPCQRQKGQIENV